MFGGEVYRDGRLKSLAGSVAVGALHEAFPIAGAALDAAVMAGALTRVTGECSCAGPSTSLANSGEGDSSRSNRRDDGDEQTAAGKCGWRFHRDFD
jgi:hypothetical protein